MIGLVAIHGGRRPSRPKPLESAEEMLPELWVFGKVAQSWKYWDRIGVNCLWISQVTGSRDRCIDFVGKPDRGGGVGS